MYMLLLDIKNAKMLQYYLEKLRVIHEKEAGADLQCCCEEVP